MIIDFKQYPPIVKHFEKYQHPPVHARGKRFLAIPFVDLNTAELSDVLYYLNTEYGESHPTTAMCYDELKNRK